MDLSGKVKIRFLGTGTSTGVPQVGCDCAACTSEDSKDKRARTCLWIHTDQKSIIIDTPPEFRELCLKNNVQKIDTVCLTHMHADHIFGLDDVRVFNHKQGNSIDVFINPGDEFRFHEIFGYAFQKNTENLIRPKFHLKMADGLIYEDELFSLEAFPVMHGSYEIRGFKVRTAQKSFAFLTDVKTLSQETEELLKDIDVLAVGAIWRNFKQHSNHLTLEEAIALSAKLNAKKTFIFHISHKMDPAAKVEKDLPKNVFLSYDGCEFEL